jgi:hypothetical protein
MNRNLDELLHDALAPKESGPLTINLTPDALTPESKAVLERVLCLRKLSRDSNVSTRRTQGRLLMTLADEQLLLVSQLLAERGTL